MGGNWRGAGSGKKQEEDMKRGSKKRNGKKMAKKNCNIKLMSTHVLLTSTLYLLQLNAGESPQPSKHSLFVLILILIHVILIYFISIQLNSFVHPFSI